MGVPCSQLLPGPAVFSASPFPSSFLFSTVSAMPGLPGSGGISWGQHQMAVGLQSGQSWASQMQLRGV